jgi:uncharacterized SAM-binding protein YcdF (DUF218 family)
VVFGLVAAAYVALRLAAFLPSSTLQYPDSGTYLHVAAQPLFSSDFLAGWRPWTLPLLYKVLPNYDDWRTAGQLVISIACWLALAGAVAWNVRRRGMQAVAFGLVLLFSLSIWITQWDRLLLTESLSVSLTAAVLAAWLVLARAPSGWTIAVVLATTLLWAFVRDTDAYLVLLTAPFVLAWGALRRPRGGPIVLAAGLLAIFAGSFAAQNAPGAEPRRIGPMYDVIGRRVLTDPDELRYFRSHCMPLPERVRALAGTTLGYEGLRPDRPLASDPRLKTFRAWVRDHGRGTLATYLLTHPYRAMKPVANEAGALLATDAGGLHGHGNSPISGFRSRGTHPLLPAPLGAVLYPDSVAAVLVWLAVAIAAAAWLARVGRAQAGWIVPVIVVVLQIPHAAIVWHGDTGDIPRHALLVGVTTRLGLLILTIFLIDAALQWRAAQRSSGVSAAQLDS